MHVKSAITIAVLTLYSTGQLALYNFIFVVDAEERESKTFNIRNRDDQARHQRGEVISLQEAIEKLTLLRGGRGLENKI